MMAAPMMAQPTRVCNCPISCSVWAVIETLVAVSIVPTNIAGYGFNPNAMDRTVPAPSGKRTPPQAAKKSRDANLAHLDQVGLYAGHEHEHDDADVGHILNALRQWHEPQDSRAKRQADEQLPEDARQANRWLRWPAIGSRQQDQGNGDEEVRGSRHGLRQS